MANENNNPDRNVGSGSGGRVYRQGTQGRSPSYDPRSALNSPNPQIRRAAEKAAAERAGRTSPGTSTAQPAGKPNTYYRNTQNGAVRQTPGGTGRQSGNSAQPGNGTQSGYYTNGYSRAPHAEYRKPAASKKNESLLRTAAKLLIIAVVCVLAVWLIMHLAGYRYGKVELASGDTVKFFGKVDSSGAPQKGKIYYSDGIVAEINMSSNLVKYSNGDVYEGDFSGYLRNGQGKLSFKSGDVYEGDFQSDLITGDGTLTYFNGDKYIGHFNDGRKDGQGTYIWADGSTYTGSFSEDKKNGSGKYIWTDGAWYEGSYYYDLKSGTGTYHFANGDEYSGDFKDDVRTGKGVYTWANGDKYEGSFVNNQLNGHGIYTWANGKIYEGDFENGRITNIAESSTEQESETTGS